MKIACISDIHGNKLALDAVLESIKAFGADKLYILGDLAMGGYDPNYTIEKLFSIRYENFNNIEIIQGNTDKLILDGNPNIPNPLMAGALALDIKEITPENKIKLQSLPKTKDINLDSLKITLCHGSPRCQDENIFPDAPIETVEEAVKNASGDLILCGHTHIPCGFSLNSGKTLINVGSIGRSKTKDKMPVYLLITVNSDGSFSFEHKKVLYDNKKVAEIISKRNFSNAKEFSKQYLED